MNNILFKSAKETLKAIQDQSYSIEEILLAHLKQIELYNPSINAITDMYSKSKLIQLAQKQDKALKNGQNLGVLHGLPITIKDSYHVKGLISSNGAPHLKNNRVNSDSVLVDRLRKAGAIIIGKTNLPLLAIDWQSTNKWFGQTNNPYDLERVAGGSSGGSAAALAAGFSALEMGSDAGGSIRVPAHFCGVCGVYPTEGALSGRGHLATPNQPRSIRYITGCGPMARTVDDLILGMEAIWGQGEAIHAEIPPVPFQQYTLDKNKPLKIAYSNSLGGVELDQEYKAVYDNFINKLKANDFILQEAKPEYDTQKAIQIWGSVVGFDFSVGLPSLMPFKKWLIYLFIYSKYKCSTWAKSLSKGINISPKNYAKALEEKELISDQFNAFFNDWDIWITPVAAIPAFKHQAAGKAFQINGKKVPYTHAFMPYNFATAIMGHPIVTIPIGQTASGLPVGIQIHGRRWKDYQLLEIAKILEGLTGGFKIPKMFL